MKQYLLDTHVFLWWLNKEKKLKKSTIKIITEPNNLIYVSVISAWEINIKLKTNSDFQLKNSLKIYFNLTVFKILNLSLNHVLQLSKLPYYHKDPFDRILIAQAQAANLTLITGDKKIWRYQVPIVKA